MQFNDPEHLEDFLKPVGGNVHIRPATGTSFNSKINLKRLKNLGIFSLYANSLLVEKRAEKDFFGLTIPLNCSLTINGKEYYDTLAHMFNPEDNFNCVGRKGTHFLVCNFFVDPIYKYQEKLLQSHFNGLNLIHSDINLHSYHGQHLLMKIAKTWSALTNKNEINPISLTELEDDLFSSFILLLNKTPNNENNIIITNGNQLKNAEEYINDNLKKAITRDQLSETTHCSIRTLSRQFIKKHGVGPMAYIKQCRLNAAYLELLGSNPENTSVTHIAYSFGFSHMGKFSIEYKKHSGESPSTSLKKYPMIA